MSDDPLKINKRTFDRVAAIYRREWKTGLEYQTFALHEFEQYLRRTFQDPISVLDVGCGVGPTLYVLTEQGFRATGIDFSPRMCRYARRHAPRARVIEGCFFTTRLEEQVQGIVLDDLIHLLPPELVPALFQKIDATLKENGAGLIGTKAVTIPEGEGGYDRIDAQGNYLFRRFLTEDELKEAVPADRFELLQLTRVSCGESKRNYLLFKKK